MHAQSTRPPWTVQSGRSVGSHLVAFTRILGLICIVSTTRATRLSGVTFSTDAVLFHLGVKLRTRDTELSSRFGAIALRAFERSEDHFTFESRNGVMERARF